MAGEVTKTPGISDASPTLFVSAKDELVSVRAINAPLMDVIEQIGQALGVAVDAQINTDDKVSVEFDNLPLKDALKRLSANYAYTTDTDTRGGKLSKLFLFPKGQSGLNNNNVGGASESETGRSAMSPEPFKFEFNPAEFMQQGQ